MIDCIIMDFDGTFTDVEAEAAPFFAAYKASLAELMGKADVEADWERALSEINKDPDAYGWMIGGKMMAPGNSDPYIRSTVIARFLLEEAGILTDDEERTAKLHDFYKTSYVHAHDVFRPDAKHVIEALLDSGRPVFVITNSQTAPVAKKLDGLNPRGREKLPVFGDAKKYVAHEPAQMDARFDALPETVELPGLTRGAFVRRGHYYDTLRSIWSETNSGPESTLVIGDIYELDLLMPARLGCKTHLLARPTTPPFERKAVVADGGRVSEDLDAVLAWLD